jgi:hypothetical protein
MGCTTAAEIADKEDIQGFSSPPRVTLMFSTNPRVVFAQTLVAALALPTAVLLALPRLAPLDPAETMQPPRRGSSITVSLYLPKCEDTRLPGNSTCDQLPCLKGRQPDSNPT